MEELQELWRKGRGEGGRAAGRWRAVVENGELASMQVAERA